MISTSDSDPFVEQVSAAIDQIGGDYRQLTGSSGPLKAMIALSGGADSTSLLVAVHLGNALPKLHLRACHVNHGLRGEESRADEEFCQDLCAALSVPFTACKLESPATDEGTLRDLRYKQLQQVCLENQTELCLTGHTLDDQVETVLFRLFRGSFLKGLGGMSVFRQAAGGFYLGRPLLSLRHRDCEAFLRRRGIAARYDSSNDNLDYSRNFIRKRVLPTIQEHFGDIAFRIERTRAVLVDDDRELEEQLNSHLSRLYKHGWSVEYLSSLSPSLLRRALARALEDHGVRPGFHRIAQLIALLGSQSQRRITLNERWDAVKEAGELRWLDKSENCTRPVEELPTYVVRLTGLTVMPGFNLCVRVEKLEADAPVYPPADAREVLADLSKLSGPLVLRARRPGDRIRPLGMTVPVRLKQYLHTHKSPTMLRFAGHTLVLSDDEDVLWVPGCGISERIAVRAHDIWRLTVSSLSHDTGSFC